MKCLINVLNTWAKLVKLAKNVVMNGSLDKKMITPTINILEIINTFLILFLIYLITRRKNANSKK
jgi:hypothetical protein